MNIQDKFKKLESIIRDQKKVAVAFSGGVDSTFLSKVSYDILGENSIAITIVSPMNSESEMSDAKEFANQIGIPHALIIDEEIEEEVLDNPVNRCYFCKKSEFSKIAEKAVELGFNTVFDGSNMDDLSDYRPGMKALQELNIMSPLKEAGLTKAEIRELSRQLGLKSWDKPALACLASRIPYGERITNEKLTKIDKSEAYIRSLGFKQFRVRTHSDIARIEIAQNELPAIFEPKLMEKISKTLKSYGYLYVALELEGYSIGSMNKVIDNS